ncbi:MAG: helix-turn-helix domain-containing protein [Raineya sp.]|jgi:transcriptional regulator with XRE-family HTH domain|nr:helix-turn-helix domain-containing protein [Raineya sp.]
MLSVYLKIAETRKSKGISQTELAERIDVSQDIISKIEKGKIELTVNRLHKIAGALGVHVKYLLFGEEENSINSNEDKIKDLEKDIELFNSNIIILKNNITKCFYNILLETIYGLLTIGAEFKDISTAKEFEKQYKFDLSNFISLKEKEKILFDMNRVLNGMKKCESDIDFFNNYSSIISQYFTQMIDGYDYHFLFENNFINNSLLERVWQINKKFILEIS